MQLGRLFIALGVLCFFAGTVSAELVDVYCNQCDYYCEEQCEDTCSWYQYNGYYYCDDWDPYWYNGNQNPEVTCECYASPWLWVFLYVTIAIIVIACCCFPPWVIIAYYWTTDEKNAPGPAEQGTYRLASALNPCPYRYAYSFLVSISCTLLRPFLLLETVRMYIRRVDVRGTRLAIDVQWADYCKVVWLPTCIFNCFTCYFYSCCGFAEKREDEFLDAHTSVEGQPGQPVVFFRAKANWWYRWLAALVTAWTCGLAYSFFYVDLVAKASSLMDLAGVGARSLMEAGQFFSQVFLPRCIIDCVTCHLYSCLGLARAAEARYTDDHLTPAQAPAPGVFTNMGTYEAGQVHYGSTTPGYSQPPMGPPPVPGHQQYVAPDGSIVAAPSAPAMDDYSYL